MNKNLKYALSNCGGDFIGYLLYQGSSDLAFIAILGTAGHNKSIQEKASYFMS
jgi:hypothetical protein